MQTKYDEGRNTFDFKNPCKNSRPLMKKEEEVGRGGGELADAGEHGMQQD